jgi:hypothetical protein
MFIQVQHIFKIESHSTKRLLKASRRERPWTTLGGGLLPPSLDILGALALIGPSCHYVLGGLLPPGLLLCLLPGLLLRLPPGYDTPSVTVAATVFYRGAISTS